MPFMSFSNIAALRNAFLTSSVYDYPSASRISVLKVFRKSVNSVNLYLIQFSLLIAFYFTRGSRNARSIYSRSPYSVNWLVLLIISTQGKILDLASLTNLLYIYQTCVFSSLIAFPLISNFTIILIENSLYFTLSFPLYLVTSSRRYFSRLASDSSFYSGAGL